MRRRAFVALALAAPAAALLRRYPGRAAAGVPRPAAALPHCVERWSWAMGQPVHLQLYADSATRGYEAAAAALAELRGVEARLTRFDDASDLSELNRMAGRRPVRVAPELLDALALAEHVKRHSRGAFDPAVEPLLEAWGFRRPRATAPTARELAEARAAVRAARVDLGAGRAFLPSRATRLDLGGIGVGYGLDRAARVLRSHGIGSALLDVSGDLIAIGAPPGAAAWRVAIATAPGAPPAATVPLRDAALATSANTMQTVRYGSLVVGHVLDPMSGGPARALRQVTVVAPRAVLADAFATAALVGGLRVLADAGNYGITAAHSVPSMA